MNVTRGRIGRSSMIVGMPWPRSGRKWFIDIEHCGFPMASGAAALLYAPSGVRPFSRPHFSRDAGEEGPEHTIAYRSVPREKGLQKCPFHDAMFDQNPVEHEIPQKG